MIIPILVFQKIKIDMTLGRKNRIFPDKYENIQINLFLWHMI